VKKRNFKGSKLSDYDAYERISQQSFPNKSFARMDKALNSGKYFKRKGIREKHPYDDHSRKSKNATPNLARNSMELNTFKLVSKRTQYNRTGDSTRESHAMSEMKSAVHPNNISSEYSFYDRGFKEYDKKALQARKKRFRPMTADARRLRGSKFYSNSKFLISCA
jgi:hypothetical protein